jgi:hypothetical protein
MIFSYVEIYRLAAADSAYTDRVEQATRALFYTAVVSRFVEMPWISEVLIDQHIGFPLSKFTNPVPGLIERLRDAFSFSRPDQEWLGEALDGQLKDWSDQPQLLKIPTYFVKRVNEDQRGTLVLRRFLVLLDTCNCPIRPHEPDPSGLNSLERLRRLAEPRPHFEHESKSCIFHPIQEQYRRFENNLTGSWLRLGELLTGPDAGIPPASLADA